MGNIIGSLISGFIKGFGDLFGVPLDFLSGKSCSSVCGSTWDLICYVENFCVANLLKMVAVLGLFYIVLLFFYLLFKIGICQCIGRGIFKMLWSCMASCLSACEYGCIFLCSKLKKAKRMKEEHLRSMEGCSSGSSFDDLEDSSISYYHRSKSSESRKLSSRRSRDWRRMHLERSLRPRSHQIRIGISKRSVYMNDKNPRNHNGHTLHNIKLIQTSKFAQKANVKPTQHRSRFTPNKHTTKQ